MIKYPIGARWEGRDHNHIYWIELRDRQEHPGHRHTDIWDAGWNYSEGSGGKSDWFTSYAMSRYYLCFGGRMKRVK